MDRERFQQHEVHFVMGMVCLCIGLSLFALSFYILPNFAFGWRYELPSFIPMWKNILQETYKLSENSAAWFIFLGLFFPALLLVVIADILSHRIEKKVYHIEDNVTKKRSAVKNTESNRLIIKMIGIIVLVFITAQFFQWIISTSPLPKTT